MNMTAAQRELRIFRLFAEQGPLQIIPESIHSMNVPAPDILCTLQSGEIVAFELVELIDQEYARRLSVLYHTLHLLRELPQRLPEPLRTRLEQRYQEGVFIGLDFANDVALRQRERAALEALEFLLAQEEIIEGHLDVEGELRVRVRAIHVRPWRWGLHFECSSSGWLADPTMERIEDKFGNTYVTDHPAELLMYTEIDLLLPDSSWRPTVEPYVHRRLGESAFRRVWLFKASVGAVEFVYPSLAQLSFTTFHGAAH